MVAAPVLVDLSHASVVLKLHLLLFFGYATDARLRGRTLTP